MKVEFDSIKWKNLLSYGNAWTEVENDRGRTLFIGKNGHGKSTFLEAWHFLLFGEPFRRVKKGQLINSVNLKEMLIEGTLRIGSKEIVIRRGLKPVVFEILVDGEPLPQNAKAKDQQKVLESILGFNAKSFTQIVILGAATFTPFMQLPAGVRRKVIEDILDISAFGDMLEIAKRLSSNCRSRISEIRERERILQEREKGKIDLLRRIRAAEETREQEIKVEIENLRTKITELLANYDRAKEPLAGWQEDLKQAERYEKIIQAGTSALESLERSVERSREKLKSLSKEDKCSRCDQIFPPNQELIDEEDLRLLTLTDQRREAQTRLDNVMAERAVMGNPQREVNAISSELSSILGEMNAERRRLNELERKLSTPKDATDVSAVETEIADVRGELSEKLRRLEEEQIDLKHLNAANDLLRDDGVKTKIIQTYLPVINQLVNKYLEALDFNVSFHLDETFQETIKSRHRDEFSYESFSEGEKQRIDLALLFTWREIAKMKNSTHTNMIVLDEIADGSLDSEGIDNFFGLLRGMDPDISAFVISHNTRVIDKFDKVLLARKVRGFSEITDDEDFVKAFTDLG